jgi:prepilin-type N-terminal cleavage/methylation domain-containing protein
MTRGSEQDSGFSLVELLVVIVLLGIVGTVTTAGVVNALRTTRVQTDETGTLESAKVAIERVTREIRGANALVTCQPRTMAFTYTQANVRTAITFTVTADSANASELTQDKTVTDLASGAATTTHTRVLGGLAIGASDAVFTYADAGGTALAAQSMSPESYNPGAVKSVGVKILMRRIGGRPSIQLYQLVSIRNFEV